MQNDEMAVIDMEAGIEHFGRGVETSVDSLLMVVEPSFDSLQLAAKINTLASEVKMNNVWAVLNKIPSVELGLKLSDQLRERDVNVIGMINYDEDVFLTSLEGRPLGDSKAEKDVAEIIDFLLDGKDNA